MPTAADAPAAAEAPPSPDEAVGPTRARWGVLFAFSLLTALNCMMWITFAPVRSQTARFYGVSGDLVDWLSMIFMALYPVVFAPMSWYIETGPVALQRGLRVSAAMNVVAALLRYLSAAPRPFALLFAGQAPAARRRASRSARRRRRRAVVRRARVGLARHRGPAVRWARCSRTSPAAPLRACRRGRRRAAAPSASTRARRRDGPRRVARHPARAEPAAERGRRGRDDEPRAARGHALGCRMLRSPTLLLLSLGYGLVVGVLYAFETLMTLLLPRASTAQLGALGTAALLAGCPRRLWGWILDRTRHQGGERRHEPAAAAALAAVAALSRRAMASAFAPLVALVVALGFLLCALLSSGFEWGVELSFPISESTVAGVLNVFGQLGGIALIYGLEAYVRAPAECVAGNGLQAAALALAAGLFALIRDEQKRQAALGGRRRTPHAGGAIAAVGAVMIDDTPSGGRAYYRRRVPRALPRRAAAAEDLAPQLRPPPPTRSASGVM